MNHREILDEHPIVVNSKLAEQVGLNQAVLLTVVAGLIKREGVVDEYGIRWARLTVNQIHDEMPFLSTSTIGRLIRLLVKDNYVRVVDTDNAFDKARLFSLGGGLI